MAERVPDPNAFSRSPARSRRSSQNQFGDFSIESPSLERQAAEMREQASPAESTTAFVFSHDSYSILPDEGHGFTNPPKVFHPSYCTPETGISIEQLHQSLDPDTPEVHISSPIEDDETMSAAPPFASLDVTTFDGNTQTTPRLSPTTTQIPNAPTAQEDLDSTSAASVPEPPLRAMDSLGILGLATLVAGHIGILGVFGFLVFLWFGFGSAPEAANATWVWRQIALSNWMTQAITLASLAIRVLVTLQATACTSMIAALILERRGARKSYLPWFSVMRGINDGPLRLVQMLLTSRSLAVAWYPEFWLALFMIIVTLALQFSSTILLSDLHRFVIVGDHNQTNVPGLISYDNETFVVHLTASTYQYRDPVFSTFGEVASTFDSSANSHGLSDTGLVQRGFLPFSDSQIRTSTRQYDGNAVVMSSRAACMRPHINGYCQYLDDGGNYKGNGYLEGNLQYASSFQEAQVNSIPPCTSGECEEEAFGCAIPSSTYGDWQSTACKLERFGMPPHTLTVQPKWRSSDLPWSANSSGFLVVSTNMRDQDWSRLDGYQSLPDAEAYHEWQSYGILPDRFLNITLCFVGVALDRQSISMNSSGNLREPVVNGSLISNEYNTGDVQKLFGVDNPRRAVAERGVLDMAIAGEAQDGPATGPAYETISLRDVSNITIAKFTSGIIELVLYAQALQVVGSNGTLAFCVDCSIISEILFDSHLGEVLNDIVTQSGQAANALVTYLTIIASAIYYDYLGAVTIPQEARTILTSEVQVPGQCSAYGCRGFIAVATLLAVHLIYVGIITVLYAKEVRYSRNANLWHAISQLATGELKETWEKSNSASDAVITEAFRKEGKDNFLKLRPLGADGQIGFVQEDMPKT